MCKCTYSVLSICTWKDLYVFLIHCVRLITYNTQHKSTCVIHALHMHSVHKALLMLSECDCVCKNVIHSDYGT